MAQAQQLSQLVFQQTTNGEGETEFRMKFGRNKCLVYRKHDQFYYVDLYDNKPGKVKFTGMCLGLDELDFLISIRQQLDTLQSSFITPIMGSSQVGNAEYHPWARTAQPAQATPMQHLPHYQAVPFPEVNQVAHYQASQNQQVQRQQTPLSETNLRPGYSFKRKQAPCTMSSTEEKRVKFESVTPPPSNDENFIPQDVLDNLFYNSM